MFKTLTIKVKSYESFNKNLYKLQEFKALYN